ncbi:hypothetical protein F5050DRAFT_1716083 [Lentinula boryana]|uniref:Uncharacterized protein n=1 Tax=Lentinula boryana TaxID=40481 RepID=A0ABQ8PYB5_9AGAR|nr:hypothetical protein F5050DRAFT_1716083 [Lentinula boryana]
MLRDRFYPTSQSLESPERVHRTHENPFLVDALKKLSLEGRLKFNREIEVKNKARHLKSISHTMGDASRPGSPTASFITVDSEEIDLIRKEPAFLKRVFEYLGPWAINFIQGRNLSDKRKTEEDAESRAVATEKKLTVYALDVQKLIEEWKLPKGGDKREGLSYSEFREAAGFLLKFEAERTVGGENSNNYKWLDNHFSFWLVHRNSESLFEFWKELEFDQRMERKVYPKPFVASSYENAWSKAENNKSRSFKVKEILAAATAAAMSAISPTAPSSSSNPSSQRPLKKMPKFGAIPTPFQSGSKGKTPVPCCLGCGKRGHQIDEHVNSFHGKLLWVSLVNAIACSPDRGNKPICFAWNIRRECKGCDNLHACSFCSRSDHHAFSWTCRKSPAP